MSRYCVQCGKANNACICDWIKPIDAQIQLVILQHPSETKRPMGTAKILHLSLSRCEYFVGEDFSQNEALNQLLTDDQYLSMVLYPSEESRVLSSESLNQINPLNKKIRLILIDGTWKKAYKIWQLSTNLHHLMPIALPNNLVGNYRIRKAPSEQHLSTVEAGFHALCIIDTETDFSPLMNTFTQMVDYQIAQMPEGVFEKNYIKLN
ncbi:tRNA-uridine aminocarboxypropyltransferase [Vibrio rumoiensis]|uniref:tRNA-uridine aminocarboxypropyltransferase n=1 Tax=Vibrio rumoiensis 1S-45 TaxID=1188252 RepID=A0A1E5E3Q7_9VIBR|nr:DTW domain-containing protein [Vibrio rumoiensis]OEF26970.1 DTW domain-containing protein [Vibrio rumoiensis 1S-45]